MAETLFSQGWALTGGVNLTVRHLAQDKDSLVFSRIPVPISTKLSCIYLEGDNTILLLDMPETEMKALIKTVRKHYGPGIQKEKVKDSGCYKIKLKGLPWMWMSNDTTMYGRNLMCHMLECVISLDWKLVCSADVASVTSKGRSRGLHSWWFVYSPPSGTKLIKC